jgi:hypothetical protein
VACRKCRQGLQQNMVYLSSSELGNSKYTVSSSYHAWWFELSTGLCATFICNSPSRTGLFSSHCGVSAVMNSGSQSEHKMSQLIIADPQGRYEVSFSPCHLLIWHHLFFSHQGTLTKDMNFGQNCPD